MGKCFYNSLFCVCSASSREKCVFMFFVVFCNSYSSFNIHFASHTRIQFHIFYIYVSSARIDGVPCHFYACDTLNVLLLYVPVPTVAHSFQTLRRTQESKANFVLFFIWIFYFVADKIKMHMYEYDTLSKLRNPFHSSFVELHIISPSLWEQ